MAYLELHSEPINQKNLKPFKPGGFENVAGGFSFQVVISGFKVEVFHAGAIKDPPDEIRIPLGWDSKPVVFPGVNNMTDLIRLIWFLNDDGIYAADELPNRWIERFIDPIKEI